MPTLEQSRDGYGATLHLVSACILREDLERVERGLVNMEIQVQYIESCSGCILCERKHMGTTLRGSSYVRNYKRNCARNLASARSHTSVRNKHDITCAEHDIRCDFADDTPHDNPCEDIYHSEDPDESKDPRHAPALRFRLVQWDG